MGTPHNSREKQANEIIDRLEDTYPDADISLEFSNRLELLIAVILSAQCTDERVNQVTDDLFEKYQSPEDYASVDVETLASDINSITYYNQKAAYIKNACQTIVDEYDGEIPDTIEELTALHGVGRKTANVVLQHGHDVIEGIVVDTHVQRLSQRLGLTDSSSPEHIEDDLTTLIPKESWQEFTHLLINHGRATCTAQNPDCADCVLEDICPSSQEQHDIDLATNSPWET
ncbi:MAG: endonuclease III [Halobacteriaceae archaeon]